MSNFSIGDMARQFTTMRTTSAIKADLAELTQNLSTGKVVDLTDTLGGETERFSAVKYSLAQLDAYNSANREVADTLSNVQVLLGQVDNVRSSMADRLLLVNESSTAAQVDEAAVSSRAAFETVVNTLNTKIADRALLSGLAVTQAPLRAADEMLTDISATIAGSTEPSAIAAAVAGWFDDPAGGFRTTGYLGDTGGPVEKRISDTQSVSIAARADDPAVVEVLKATALAAIASDQPGLETLAKADLLKEAGESLFAASSNLLGIQARVGFTQGIVSNAIASNAAQETAFNIMQNDATNIDPFVTAAKLQAVQLQLETHFTVIGRLAPLSLLRYI